MSEYLTITQRNKLINELKQLEEKFKKTSSSSDKMDILYDIKSYQQILNNVFPEYKSKINKTSKDSKLLKKHANDSILIEVKELKSELNTYKELCKNINNIFKSNKNFKYKFEKNKNLTKSNLLIFKELIKNYFPEDFSTFVDNEIKDERLILTNYYADCGTCFPIMSLDEDFSYYLCEISNGLTIYDFFTIIHELVHGYIFYSKDYYSTIYEEVYSHFYEMRLSNIISNKYGLTKDEKNHDIYYLDNTLSCNESLYENLNYIKKLYRFENISRKFELEYNDEAHIYLIAYILGLKLYYQDLEDTELAHYNINKMYDEDYNRLSDINKLEHISLEEIVSGDPVKKFIKEANEKWTSNKK